MILKNKLSDNKRNHSRFKIENKNIIIYCGLKTILFESAMVSLIVT